MGVGKITPFEGRIDSELLRSCCSRKSKIAGYNVVLPPNTTLCCHRCSSRHTADRLPETEGSPYSDAVNSRVISERTGQLPSVRVG